MPWPDPVAAEELAQYETTEVGMAKLAAWWLSSCVRWCPDQERYYVWSTERDGSPACRWRVDGKQAELVRGLVLALADEVRAGAAALDRHLAAQGVGADDVRRTGARRYPGLFSTSAKISSIARLLQAQGALHVNTDMLDADGALLNFLNGTYDVRTGTLRPHDSADLLTSVVPWPLREDLLAKSRREIEAMMPGFRWLLFRMCGRPGSRDGSTGPEVDAAVHDMRMRAVLRVFGYCLLGGNPERKMFIIEGATAIGKNQIIEIICELIGPDYSWMSARPAIITRGRHPRHDSESYGLIGKRLVNVNELESTHRFDEGRIRELINVPGSRVSVRGMRENLTETPVTWKITSTTNEIPRANMSPPVKERIMIIPVSKIPVPHHARRDVKTMIMPREAEPILVTLVQEMRQWWLAWRAGEESATSATTGLVVTEEMSTALDSFEEGNQHPVGLFLSERTEVVPGAYVKSTVLWNACQEYVKRQHPDQRIEYLGGRNFFYEQVTALSGVTRHERKLAGRSSELKGFHNLRLIPADVPSLSELSAMFPAREN